MSITNSSSEALSTWDRLGAEQRDLLAGSLAQVDALQSSLSELQQEAAAYKAAFASASKELEEAKALAHSFQRSLEDYKTPSILVAIDGDGYPFASSFVQRGRSGGQEAAAALKARLMGEGTSSAHLLVFVFLNRQKTKDTLMASGALRRRDDFEQFLMGFNQASPLFQMVDVGHGKEVADAKIKDLCTYFARLPQIQSIYLAGGHDGGYATFIRSLTTDGFGKKVVLLRSDTPFARDIAALNQPEVDCRDLFLSSRFTPASGTAGGAVVTPQLHGVNLLVPEPTPVVDSPQASNSPERLCFHFYLWPDGCHDQNCKFKHDMTVSREHVAALAKRLNFAHPPLRAEMLSRTVPPPAYESASMTAIPVANKHVYTPSQELLQEAEGPKPSPTLTVTALSPQLQKTLQPLISVLQKQFKKGTSDVPWCRVADFLKEDHKNYLGRNGVPDTFSAYVTLAKQHGVVSVCSHPKNYNLSTIALTPQWLVR